MRPDVDPNGLTEAEARRRLAERPPSRRTGGSRSYRSIVRANVLTVFNLILASFGTVTLLYGDWRDALFLGILVANTGIGIVQEVRAKRALDRLSALVEPTATVVREGAARRLHVDEVVPGDLIRLAPGDQVIADGRIESAEGLTLDESILTGESAPVRRGPGEEVRSGSFALEGRGSYSAEAVGAESYAERVAGEARAFRHPRSPLELAFNRLLLGLVAVMVPLGAVLGVSLWQRETSLDETVSTSVAAVVSLVPEGLMVLASLTYAVAALRMSRRGALAQQLNAIESLAAADIVCTDKTGTLTEASLRVVDVVPASGDEESLRHALGVYAASSPARNSTLEALASELEGPAVAVAAEVPFSSGRRWSALTLDGTTYVLGAPELLPLGSLRERVAAEQRSGRRVLAFAQTDLPLADGDRPRLPDGLRPGGAVVLAERLRPDARATVEYFRAQGVELKVLSGDAPETVAAIAADAGIPVTAGAVDGSRAADDPGVLRQAVRSPVVGRISPEGKRAVVAALREEGRYVAMVGDGVNDVPALKEARLAIAQGSGTQMAKSVADLVLVRGDFGAVPGMVAEGRQILRNLQRVAKLYVSKSAFAAFLVLTVGTTATAYPLLPRHFSLAASLTIGIPSFLLALAPSTGPWDTSGFLRRLARFAVPAGAAAGIGVVSSYQFALNALELPLLEARTVAASVLVLVGLYLVLALEGAGGRRGRLVAGMCVLLLGAYVLALALPPTRDFFELAAPSLEIVATAVAGAAIAVAGLELMGLRQEERSPSP
ncbi:MAG: HAD-IC family P-type ATPase [Thermoleophilaceae bacterium]|nr:HAD-IC family P-type ATPase [Thermoleophilaceae bacterium]